MSTPSEDRQRGIVSVTNKAGLEEFAKGLTKWFDLEGSGNTAKMIRESGTSIRDITDVTGIPEMMDGRIKTLNHKVEGGILADRSKPEHLASAKQHGIGLVGIVVVNYYDFVAEPSIEHIDIGGPTMVRAAAKNYEHVIVVVDPNDYHRVLVELEIGNGTVSLEMREELADKAWAITADYDAAISNWRAEQRRIKENKALPATLHVAMVNDGSELRYGENPHQAGARYYQPGKITWQQLLIQHQGIKLSYLNLLDAEAAWRLANAFEEYSSEAHVAAIIKHANPCGFALGHEQVDAYKLAFSCDEQSAFGGIVAFNRPLTMATAELMFDAAQADVVIAPSYEEGTREVLLQKRKNTRLLEAQLPEPLQWDIRQLGNDFLVQQPHHFAALRGQWKVVTKRQPTDQEWDDAELAHLLDGYVKSNSIVLVRDGVAWGIGAGQQKRVDSARIAATKAAGRAKGGAAASDAFFPFPDGIEALAESGVTVVIQPGGAMGDDAVIAKADELGMAMIFTSERHFLH